MVFYCTREFENSISLHGALRARAPKLPSSRFGFGNFQKLSETSKRKFPYLKKVSIVDNATGIYTTPIYSRQIKNSGYTAVLYCIWIYTMINITTILGKIWKLSLSLRKLPNPPKRGLETSSKFLEVSKKWFIWKLSNFGSFGALARSAPWREIEFSNSRVQ